ncbi:MAG TPA: winged helix-turn-helix domain-containing protein [Bryobacteraceae bacterium]|nr:winged helix-turn-helix domain-containing protein [Bryobacteraceae bacterium]
MRIKLQDQPFRILILLLERPGEVVRRDEIRQCLWPDGTFVDFEHSLNAAVAKLRQALSDSADTPRFIETVPKQGYRFIAPVQHHGQEPVTDARSNSPPTSPHVPVVEAGAAIGRTSWQKATGAVVVFAGMGLLLWLLFQRGDSAKSRSSLVGLTSVAGLATDPAISPNGKMIAFSSDRAGSTGLDIWLQPSDEDGGEAVRLTTNSADEQQPAFSPDGHTIVYRSEQEGGGIYSIPARGGKPVLLAKYGRDPQFSPAGTLVAYWVGQAIGSPVGATSTERSLFVVSAHGGEAKEVRSDLREAGQPIWAPDGEHLLVYGSRGEATDLPIGSGAAAGDWWVVPLKGGTAVSTGALAAFAKQGLSTAYPSPIPRPRAWVESQIFFAGQLQGNTNLWSARISTDDWQIRGPAQRLTFGSGFEVMPAVSATGAVVFASIALHSNIWALPLQADTGRVTGPLKRITSGAWMDSSPSISGDGTLVVFDAIRSPDEKEVVWVQNTETGKGSALASHQTAARHPEISDDGEQVAYATTDGLYVIPSKGGEQHQLCGAECSFPWDWTPDGKSLIISNRLNASEKLERIDVKSKRRSEFLMARPARVFQARIAPDERSLAFVSTEFTGIDCTVFITPLRNGVPGDRDEWIRIGPSNVWNDKPRWSPSGDLLYFTSEKDGFRCVWAQRIDRVTRRAAGPLMPIAHFHEARLSTSNVGYGQLEIALARDKLVLNLGELTGNLWKITSQSP